MTRIFLREPPDPRELRILGYPAFFVLRDRNGNELDVTDAIAVEVNWPLLYDSLNEATTRCTFGPYAVIPRTITGELPRAETEAEWRRRNE